jgi:hypothetical protein
MRVGRMRQVMAALQERFLTMVPEVEAHLQRSAHQQAPEFHLTTTPEGAYAAVDERCGIQVLLCTPQEASGAFGA